MEEIKLLETNPQIAQTTNEPNARPLPAAVRGGLPPHKLQKVLSYIDEKLAEPVGVRGSSSCECATQQRDLDMIVEVTGLQRGVLPVVHEGQQLAGLGCEILGSAQASHDARAHDGHC